MTRYSSSALPLSSPLSKLISKGVVLWHPFFYMRVATDSVVAYFVLGGRLSRIYALTLILNLNSAQVKPLASTRNNSWATDLKRKQADREVAPLSEKSQPAKKKRLKDMVL
jgi:hypothetical protein